MHIDLKFNLILEWLDHKVVWVNLKADDHLNTLSNIELDKLWLPKVLFQNSDNIEPIKHKDSSTVVMVRRQGEGELLAHSCTRFPCYLTLILDVQNFGSVFLRSNFWYQCNLRCY